jgi:hypothetical protein
MAITLNCASKRDPLQRGSRIHTVECTNTDNLEDGSLDAPCHTATSDPEFADRFAISGSYSPQLPD